MPFSNRVFAVARLEDAEVRPLSWIERASVHINTPMYPSFQESSFTADDGAIRCVCPVCGGASPSDPEYFMPPQSGVAGNGLPIYNYDQAAAQLTRSSNGWGPGAVVTYGFRATEPAQMPGVTGFVQFNAAQIAMTIEALALWAEVANITFVRVADMGEYTDSATMLFSNYTSGPEDASAFAYYPGASANAGDVWINFSLESNNSNLVEGAFGPHTMSHEIGHAIGLAHPANYDALDGVTPTYPESSVYWQDSRMYSVMSYFGSAGPGGSLNNFSSGPQLHDIAAAQLLYGANMTTRTGDTVYGFNSNTGHAHFTILADEAGPVFSIWDAGGNDTLDLSGYSTPVELDLRAESFSSAGPGSNPAFNGRAHGNISIARGVVIENGIGGSGADTLIGNDVANTLTGNAGADRMTGNAGADTLIGGAGVDTAVYAIASTTANWARNPDGTWTVMAGAEGTDTLTSVEYLDFTDRDVFLDRAASTFTGDGTSDIIVRNTTTGGLAAWFVSGGTVSAGGLGTVDASWQIQGVGDFNGDGRDDIFWRNSGGGLAAWFMNGTASTGAVLGSTTNSWSVETVGDFNGDGTDDIVWRDSGGGLAAWFFNNGVASGGVLGSATSNWVIEGAADFNGDGRDDILWRDTSSGALAAWFMNGAIATGGVLGVVDAGWTVEGFGDFNGDGRDDILWRNSSDALATWFMNGTSSTGGVLGVVDGGWSVQSVGDYNGDGRDDILWRNGDIVAAWYMNGTAANGVILSSLSQDWIIDPYG